MTEMKTFGPAIVEVATRAGIDVDDEQRRALDQMLISGQDARWAFPEFTTGADVGALRVVAGLFLLGERITWWAADGNTAREAFHEIRALIDAIPGLREGVRFIRATNGNQRIELRDGRMLRLVPRGSSGGRGLTADLNIADNVRGVDDVRRQMLPGGLGRSNPQFVYLIAPVEA